ncbi:MAG: hypothetical protein AAGH64_07785 [Planctomycetota bacterium]
MQHARLFVLALLALTVVCVPIVDAQPERRERPKKPSVLRLDAVRAEAARIIEHAARVGDDDDTDHADDARLLLARVARYADPEREEEAFIVAAHALRTATILGALSDYGRQRVAQTFLDHPELSREIAFTWWEGEDDPARVCGVLLDLTETHTARAVARAPRLVAALCVVHDEPGEFRLNENLVRAESPSVLFEYFAGARLNGLVGRLSPELLVWVVDAVDAHELVYANRKHSGHSKVGQLFHSIEYDTEHFQLGRPKRVTERGLTLPNIAEFGGVCIDQAHYAVQTARALGVPAAICRGRGSSVGHAWVGYLRVNRNAAWWDFDEGRYEEYAKVRGNVEDPQRRTTISDGMAAARAASYGLGPDARHLSVALHDAARVMNAYPHGWTDEVAPFVEDAGEQRGSTIDDRLAMLRASVTLNPGELRSWEAVTALASAMGDGAKNEWATAAMRLAGDGFKEFAVDFSMPLVESLEDAGRRSAVLGRVYEYCRRDRPGVAAELMLANARLYERTGDPERAYEALAFTAVEFADTSSHAVTALGGAVAMLHEHGHTGMAVDLARKAWGRTTQPSFSPEFAGSSNWTRLGRIYADSLARDGQSARAQAVRRQIDDAMRR